MRVVCACLCIGACVCVSPVRFVCAHEKKKIRSKSKSSVDDNSILLAVKVLISIKSTRYQKYKKKLSGEQRQHVEVQ